MEEGEELQGQSHLVKQSLSGTRVGRGRVPAGHPVPQLLFVLATNGSQLTLFSEDLSA